MMIREEEIKSKCHPLDAWDRLVQASKAGFGSIHPDDFLRFRWFGLYQQKPKTDPYFMLRIKIPGGQLNSRQLRVVAGVARDYARGITDLTTRQNFQFHWQSIENIPAILEKFNRAGITSHGACGDTTRNIVSSPMAGLEVGEVDDVTDIVKELHKILSEEKTCTNLPRKFKISLSGSPRDVSLPEINDVGVYGFWRTVMGVKKPAFALRVGGGLSATPMFSRLLPVALRREDIVPVVLGVAGIFRDFGNRENRKKARMKFLLEDWGAEKFLKEIERRLGRKLEYCGNVPPVQYDAGDFFGVLPQKQTGLYAIGLAVLAGRIRADRLMKLADLSEQYGTGDLRTTQRQNIVVINIPEKNVDLLKRELIREGFNLGSNGIYRAAVTCTGIEFCNLALTETKIFTQSLIEYLASKFPDICDTVSIHVTGCPNACAQYQVADIGLVGTVRMDGAVRREAYHIAVGFALGVGEHFNRHIFSAVPAEEVPKVLERMIYVYLSQKNAKDSFVSFCNRFPSEDLFKLFGGFSAGS